MAETRRIAKNTIYLYIRMILVMGVTIYTSRVILDKLGVNDYGLYNAVASIVAVMTFLNATLSTSTSRFLTYCLGKGEEKELSCTFSTAFFTHLALAILIVLVMETIGLWYLSNKFVIPEGREVAAQAVFQLSILSSVIMVMQVPYTSSIIAHENMNVYAYLGIYDVFAQLGIVFLLSVSPFDKLIFYASLLVAIRFSVFFIYWAVCRRRYKETSLTASFERDTFKGMLGFTGWTAVANLSNTVTVQGAILLLNLFFTPAIIASKALANQVAGAVMQFVENFRVALNPQIIKSYAVGNYEESKRLTLKSTYFAFDLLLVVGLPFVFTLDTVFSLWLVEVPPLAVQFTQIAILTQIVNSISSSTYIPFVTSGRLKLNAICAVSTAVAYFVALYIAFWAGGSALWVQYLLFAVALLGVLVFRPLLLHYELGYSYQELFLCYWRCTRVLATACVSSYVVVQAVGSDSLIRQTINFIAVFSISTFCCYLFMDKQEKQLLKKLIKNRIQKQ